MYGRATQWLLHPVRSSFELQDLDNSPVGVIGNYEDIHFPRPLFCLYLYFLQRCTGNQAWFNVLDKSAGCTHNFSSLLTMRV